MKLKATSKIPYFFVAFFVVIIAVNLVYIYLARTSWSGVAVKDSYRKGIEYNQTIAFVKRQEELGWKMQIKFANLGKQKGKIIINLLNKRGAPIKGAQIVGKFKRPTKEGFDFNHPIHYVDGIYQARIYFPLKGQWDFEINAVKDGDAFRQVKRYVVQ